jgi:hypothetical protein
VCGTVNRAEENVAFWIIEAQHHSSTILWKLQPVLGLGWQTNLNSSKASHPGPQPFSLENRHHSPAIDLPGLPDL